MRATPNTLARRRHPFWAMVAALLLVGQVALGIHQLEHRLNPDLLAGDDCAVCQFASTATAGPAPIDVVVPVVFTYERRIPAAQDLAPAVRRVSAFRSRAPPVLSAA
jgi:hypothetical protein